MSEEINSATIAIERNDTRAEYDGFDAYDVIIRNPHGTLPSGLWERVEDDTRKAVDLSELADGETKIVGEVTYTADEIQEISIR